MCLVLQSDEEGGDDGCQAHKQGGSGARKEGVRTTDYLCRGLGIKRGIGQVLTSLQLLGGASDVVRHLGRIESVVVAADAARVVLFDEVFRAEGGEIGIGDDCLSIQALHLRVVQNGHAFVQCDGGCFMSGGKDGTCAAGSVVGDFGDGVALDDESDGGRHSIVEPRYAVQRQSVGEEEIAAAVRAIVSVADDGSVGGGQEGRNQDEQLHVKRGGDAEL